MKSGLVEFREIRTQEGGVDFISTSPVGSGVFQLESVSPFFEVSIFYEGQGDRLLVKVDRVGGFLQVLRYSSGYQQVLCQRRFSRNLSEEVQIAFCQEWIEVKEGGQYLGSSYLEGGMTGYVRIPGKQNQVSSSEEFSIHPADPVFSTAFFGDGFTGGNWPHVNFWMYPDLLLGGVACFLNAGVSAANTRKILDLSRKVATSDYYFEKIVLMVGVDDIIDGIPVVESEKNYRAIVDMLKDRCDVLILCSLTPRFDQLSPAILSFNRFVGTLADQKKIRFADVHTSFEKSDARSLISLGDFPNAAGQKVIASCLAEHFSDSDIAKLKEDFVERPLFSRLLFRLSQKFQGLAGKIKF